MWDVKLMLTPPKRSFAPTFYLNYVGCKVGMSTGLSVGLCRFYLNYVGCKGVAIPFFDYPLGVGFI